MKKQSGFTLIELIMVIVILGILAATALPRFVDLGADADRAAAQGYAGAIASSASIRGAAANIPGQPAYSSAAACTGTYLESGNVGSCASAFDAGTGVCTVTCNGQAASAVLP